MREAKNVEVDVGDAAHPRPRVPSARPREGAAAAGTRRGPHERRALLRAYNPWTSDELSTLWSEDVDAVLEHLPDRLRDEPPGVQAG